MAKKITTFIITAILLTACYEVGEIQVKEDAGAIVFSLSQNFLKSKNAESYILSDLSVAKDNCEKDCVVWAIVNKSVNIDKLAQNTPTPPVQYGHTPPNMQVNVQAGELRSGKYTVAATVGYISPGTITGGGLVHGNFELVYDEGKKQLKLK